MQFADPTHAAAQALSSSDPVTVQPLLAGTPFYLRDEHVYSDFVLPQQKSLVEQRAEQTAGVLHGVQQTQLPVVPALPPQVLEAVIQSDSTPPELPK